MLPWVVEDISVIGYLSFISIFIHLLVYLSTLSLLKVTLGTTSVKQKINT